MQPPRTLAVMYEEAAASHKSLLKRQRYWSGIWLADWSSDGVVECINELLYVKPG